MKKILVVSSDPSHKGSQFIPEIQHGQQQKTEVQLFPRRKSALPCGQLSNDSLALARQGKG